MDFFVIVLIAGIVLWVMKSVVFNSPSSPRHKETYRTDTIITSTKKKIWIIALVVMAIPFVLYALMFFSTNSVMREVESVFMLEVDYSELEGRAINRYNRNWVARLSDREVGEINLSLRRRFVIHNFRTGYIWAIYSHTVYDTGGVLITGSWRVPTRWRIERIDGAWEIVRIYERP